jgi:large subunit ribosomal protein L9
MEVILIEDVHKLGDMGDVVNVKDGYARNYLIPQKLALLASRGKKTQFLHQQKMVEGRKAKMQAEAALIQGKINAVSVTIARKSGQGDKLYGSVTNRDIGRALSEIGVEIDHKKIMRDHPLRELGIYPVDIKLHAGISAQIKVWVVAI